MISASKPLKKTIQGVHIDARNQTVTDIEFEPTRVEMYRLVDCDTVQFVRLYQTTDAVIVDDNGLQNNPKHFFSITGRCGGPLAGNGLIVGGPDGNGDETDSTLKAADLNVTFLSLDRASEVTA
ncbi:hypothetical protein BH10ACI2_BH10ACI2_00350 [soil metagenome]